MLERKAFAVAVLFLGILASVDHSVVAEPAPTYPREEIKAPSRRVCGELAACELIDISSHNTVVDLYLIDVEYILKAGASYSITCKVYGGDVDALHITYGNGKQHTEKESPYWVGGDIDGVPRAVDYLATPGEKVFNVRGVLDGGECFLVSQKLIATLPNGDEL